MQHIKNHQSIQLNNKGKKIIVEGPVTAEFFANCKFDSGLIAFRPAEQQHKALINVVKSCPEARMIIAREDNLIVGYAILVFPDPLERWSEVNLENLLVLGAIEVSDNFRGHNIAKSLLKVTMMDDAIEDYIVITTEYHWHWDLKKTGLSIWGYRDVMEKVMQAGGLVWHATDDPEINSHPANCLMARIGKRVKYDDVLEFNRVRFKHKYML